MLSEALENPDATKNDLRKAGTTMCAVLNQLQPLHDAAPDLLAALKMCVAIMDDPPEVIRSNDTDAYRNAVNAIAKATGQMNRTKSTTPLSKP
jgi:hypothetical protein